MTDLDTGLAERLEYTEATIGAIARLDDMRSRCAHDERTRAMFNSGLVIGERFGRFYASREALSQAWRVRDTMTNSWADTFRDEIGDFTRTEVDAGRISTMDLPVTRQFQDWEGSDFDRADAERASAFLWGVCHACAELFEQLRI